MWWLCGRWCGVSDSGGGCGGWLMVVVVGMVVLLVRGVVGRLMVLVMVVMLGVGGVVLLVRGWCGFGNGGGEVGGVWCCWWAVVLVMVVGQVLLLVRGWCGVSDGGAGCVVGVGGVVLVMVDVVFG